MIYADECPYDSFDAVALNIHYRIEIIVGLKSSFHEIPFAIRIVVDVQVSRNSSKETKQQFKLNTETKKEIKKKAEIIWHYLYIIIIVNVP